MYKNILIPTDGSELSEKVVQDAIALAKATHAKITAVHVYAGYLISPYGLMGPRDDVVEQKTREFAINQGKEYVGRIEAAAKQAGVPFDSAIVEGDAPWQGIIETADKKHCDLVMMAAHGRHGLAAIVLGSETNKVLTHSKVPVLVYH